MSHIKMMLTDDGNPPKTWVARISHECVDGTHFFTSEDIDGLLLFSKDPHKIMRQLIPTIQVLLRENEGVEVMVEIADIFGRKMSSAPAVKDTFAVIRKAA